MHPDDYAKLELNDQWIEDIMQEYEAKLISNNINDGAKVIDFGYGNGIICESLLKKPNLNYTLVDGSFELLSRAKSKHKNCNGRLKTTQSMFEDYDTKDHFDIAIASFVLEHMKDPLDFLKRCRKFADHLIVFIGNAKSLHRRLAVTAGLVGSVYELSERDKEVGHYHLYDLDMLKAHLARAGWTPVDEKGIFLKVVNNAKMVDWPKSLIHAMCKIQLIDVEDAANIGVICD
jgi:SAM-dependent methyltransferase